MAITRNKSESIQSHQNKASSKTAALLCKPKYAADIVHLKYVSAVMTVGQCEKKCT